MPLLPGVGSTDGYGADCREKVGDVTKEACGISMISMIQSTNLKLRQNLWKSTKKHGDIIGISPGWEYGEEKLTISYSIQN